jgi:hypothetical protein
LVEIEDELILCLYLKSYSTSSPSTIPKGGPPTGHATVAAVVVSIELRAQLLLLIDSPLQHSFVISLVLCLSQICLQHHMQMLPLNVENIPVNAAHFSFIV